MADHINSQTLEDSAKILDAKIKEFDQIIADIREQTNTLLQAWHGEGKKQFELDYNTIFQQLEDVDDVMYDLYDSLVDADAEYVLADEEIAKKMTIS